MISQFFKIAGVTNAKDFYAKYPDEQDFFNEHPEAQFLINLPRYQQGQTVDGCPPGYAYDGEVDDCVKLPADSDHPNNVPQTGTPPANQNTGQTGNTPPPNTQQQTGQPGSISGGIPGSGKGFHGGIGLKSKNYGFNYGIDTAPDLKSDIVHHASLTFPNLFSLGKDKKASLDINGMLAANKAWNSSLKAGIPLSRRGDARLSISGGLGQSPVMIPNMQQSQGMMTAPSGNPLNWNAAIGYKGRLGKKGPELNIDASYRKKDGGYYSHDGSFRKAKGSGTMSGNVYFKNGGMPCYECGGMYAEGGDIPNYMKETSPMYNFGGYFPQGPRFEDGGLTQYQQRPGTVDNMLHPYQKYVTYPGDTLTDNQLRAAQLQMTHFEEPHNLNPKLLRRNPNYLNQWYPPQGSVIAGMTLDGKPTSDLYDYGDPNAHPSLYKLSPTDIKKMNQNPVGLWEIFKQSIRGGSDAAQLPYATKPKVKKEHGGLTMDGIRMGQIPVYGDGGIHIKPSHRGRFTEYKKRTGKTTEEALHSPNAHVRQMANFARNASKWKHEEGGLVAGQVMNVTPEMLQELERGGYTYEIIND